MYINDFKTLGLSKNIALSNKVDQLFLNIVNNNGSLKTDIRIMVFVKNDPRIKLFTLNRAFRRFRLGMYKWSNNLCVKN